MTGSVSATDIKLLFEYEFLYWIAYQMAKDSGEDVTVSEWEGRKRPIVLSPDTGLTAYAALFRNPPTKYCEEE